MSLKTAVGEVFPRWQGSVVDLAKVSSYLACGHGKSKPRAITFCKRYASSASVMKLGR